MKAFSEPLLHLEPRLEQDHFEHVVLRGLDLGGSIPWQMHLECSAKAHRLKAYSSALELFRGGGTLGDEV